LIGRGWLRSALGGAAGVFIGGAIGSMVTSWVRNRRPELEVTETSQADPADASLADTVDAG